MNGCLFSIFLALLIQKTWLRQDTLARSVDQGRQLLKALEARQYLLEISADDFLSRRLLDLYQKLFRSGRLSPESLRLLIALLWRLRQSDRARIRQTQTVLWRLTMAACIAQLAASLLSKKWLLSVFDNPPLILLFIAQGILITVCIRSLARHPLEAAPQSLIDFAYSWMGESSEGPWRQDLEKLTSEACRLGRDSSRDRQTRLEDWLWAHSEEQKTRLERSEDWFALVELLGSLGFLSLAIALPLLQRFTL